MARIKKYDARNELGPPGERAILIAGKWRSKVGDRLRTLRQHTQTRCLALPSQQFLGARGDIVSWFKPCASKLIRAQAAGVHQNARPGLDERLHLHLPLVMLRVRSRLEVPQEGG